MIMKIPMETTIDNLKKLDSQEYEQVSVIISMMVEKNTSNKSNVSVGDALAFGEEMCNKYADAFKVLAN